MRKIRKDSKSKMTYQESVELIADNDGDGDPDRLDLEFTSCLTSVTLIADIFGVSPERLAKDIIKYRKQVGI